ncbi:MAG: SH3 domain-containing protein, partial [Kofleriaceae bacterium]
MRVLGLFVVLALAATGTASAEKVKANQETRVLNHPGEQGKLVVKVKEGQSMTLIGTEGRWLKVRVQGRTGWVPRSKVEMADPDEIARNTRRRPFVDGRSTHRGFGTSEAPDDRIGADAVGNGDEDEKKPAAKDEEDEKPTKKPAAKKPSKDEDEEEDEKPTKKPAAKPAVKKPAKDEDEEEDEKPVAKKPAAKPAAKKPAKDEDEEEDEKPAAKKPAAKDEDDEDKKVADKEEEEPADKRAKAHVGEKTKVFGERDEGSDVEFTAKP